MAPQTTERQISKGTAAKVTAARRATNAAKATQRDAAMARIDEKDNAEDFIAQAKAVLRQDALGNVVDAEGVIQLPVEYPAGSLPEGDQVDELVLKVNPVPVPAAIHYTVNGKPVGETQNRLSSVSRVTATKTAPRWPAPQFRAYLVEAGVADPEHDAPWEIELPNGVKVGAILASGLSAARRAATATKAAPRKRTSARASTDSLAALKAEKAAVDAWKAGGEQGERPATPLHEQREAQEAARLASQRERMAATVAGKTPAKKAPARRRSA